MRELGFVASSSGSGRCVKRCPATDFDVATSSADVPDFYFNKNKGRLYNLLLFIKLKAFLILPWGTGLLNITLAQEFSD